ncbi:response regulator transcription factor [Taibaiella koreensis]|uniref:response regulator transcription factor n=1 Tax=Taibaiella koreensis TaxID=1268548 RepID=UPI000E59ADF9|nr:response regulator transcription factor [Taibaiella koreensis]
MPLNLLIADDHAVVRHGVSLLLREMIPAATLSQAYDYDTLTAALKKGFVDLVICDINMPGCDGFHVIDDLRSIQPDVRILIFSAYREDLYAPRYLQAGANGYLHKDGDNDQIRKAVLTVLQDGRYMSDAVKEKLLHKALGAHKQTSDNPLDLLSQREMEVARLLLRGLGLLEISNALKLHIATVSTYKKRIYEKVQVASLPELIAVFRNHAGSLE